MVKTEIPRQLHMALIRIQAEEDLDFIDACIKASILLPENSTQYKEEVKKEAEQIHKVKFMREVGKTHESWKKKYYGEGFRDGENAGYRKGVNDYKITYPCHICGKPIVMAPGGNDHQAMVEMMKQKGWAHGDCLKSQNRK